MFSGTCTAICMWSVGRSRYLRSRGAVCNSGVQGYPAQLPHLEGNRYTIWVWYVNFIVNKPKT